MATPRPRRIYLGPADDDFDPAHDVAAGPWCFIGHEQACAAWETLDFPEPFDTVGKIVDQELAIRRLVDDLARDWAVRLNAKHGLNRPVLFWHRYLLLWLSLSAMASWARWRYVEELVRTHGSQPAQVPIVSSQERWPSDDFPELFDAFLYKTEFQLWLDSRIAHALVPPAWTLVNGGAGRISAKRTAGTERPSSRGSRLSAWVRTWIPRLPFDHMPGVGRRKLLLSALLALLPRKSAKRVDLAPPGSGKRCFPPAYLALLDDLLARTIPDSFAGERFKELDAKAARLGYSPGRLYIANTRAVDDWLRLVSAHALIAGERLVNSQHGGFEGTSQAVPWNAHVYDHDHAFLTWGWDRQADLPGNCVPFLSPELAAIRNQHRAQDDSLVLVGARMSLNGMRFDCIPRPRAMLQYRADKLRFLGALPDGIRKASRYRPYTRSSIDLEDGPFITRHFSDVPLVMTGFQEAMLHCRLLVLDHPGTTLNMALAANVPFVAFWNRHDWPLCHEAQPYFDQLATCGVLHDEPEQAARHIATIWDQVGTWWSRPEISSAAAQCRQRFARTGTLANLDLVRTLWRLSQTEMQVQPIREAAPSPHPAPR